MLKTVMLLASICLCMHTYMYMILNSYSYLVSLFIAGIVNENDSLFVYSTGESWFTYHDLNFLPSYNPVFLNVFLESEARKTCDNDQFCLYDIATTGRLDIGLATLDGSRNFDKMVKLSYPGT